MLCGGNPKLIGVAVLALGASLALPPAPTRAASPPAAFDFEQRLRGGTQRVSGAAAGSNPEGPVRYRTGPIRAPRRFDLVGVARNRSDLEYRTRREGKRWSDWVEATDGSPVWAGGANLVQIRSRNAPIEGRLHYVNVTPAKRTAGTAGAAARKRRSRSLSYVPRSAWGADRKDGGCPPRVKPSYGAVKLAAIHHTVSTNDYPAELGPAVVLGICRYHRNANGWNDIGYNALVDRFGVLYEGRAGGLSRAVIGAHAGDWNARVSGVALIGNHVATKPSNVALSKLVKYLAWKLTTHRITRAKGRRKIKSYGGPVNRYPAGKWVRLNYVLTHRHLNSTSCAGDATEGVLRRLRERIQSRMNAWGGVAPALVPTDGTPPVTPEPEPQPEGENGGVSPG